jgi:hypothetical protein
MLKAKSKEKDKIRKTMLLLSKESSQTLHHLLIRKTILLYYSLKEVMAVLPLHKEKLILGNSQLSLRIIVV